MPRVSRYLVQGVVLGLLLGGAAGFGCGWHQATRVGVAELLAPIVGECIHFGVVVGASLGLFAGALFYRRRLKHFYRKNLVLQQQQENGVNSPLPR
jgi:hypothetical protein